MMNLLFQYCPKIAVVSQDRKTTFLCRRAGELDYDGVYSMIGGKMERTDKDIVEAIRREKIEEVGEDFRVRLFPSISVDVHFVKHDGTPMILPHFLAFYVDGDPVLNSEYSEYSWVPINDLNEFGPKIKNISWITKLLVGVSEKMENTHSVEI